MEFKELRDKCQNPKIEEVDKIYKALYKLLEDTNNMDFDYLDHFKEKFFTKIEKLTFKQCCTALTFILRSEHFSNGSFADYFMDRTVYRLLDRAAQL